MKNVISVIIFFLIYNLNAQKFEFKLYHCESTSLVIIKNDSLHFENTLLPEIIKFDTLICKNDIDSLNLKFQEIFNKEGNEVWLNHCYDDGVNLKFYVTQNGTTKKVFVGNYFDYRLNAIALIINDYLINIKKNITINKNNFDFIATIPYGTTNENIIKQEIENQKACEEAPDSYKDSMLNIWCEAYK